jgi:hypothetical protein
MDDDCYCMFCWYVESWVGGDHRQHYQASVGRRVIRWLNSLPGKARLGWSAVPCAPGVPDDSNVIAATKPKPCLPLVMLT